MDLKEDELIHRLISDISAVLGLIIKTNNSANAVGCVDGSIIGTGRADYTKNVSDYVLKVKDREFLLKDLPGIEGDERKYRDSIKQALEQSHLIIYVNGSEKKVENESLQKIRQYMHDGTSVYTIINTHCKPKSSRVLGIDKSYSEELKSAYKKEKSVINQINKELKAFLGDNYKGCMSVNGLLGFCSVAFYEKESTSIQEDSSKNLRKDQNKFLREYSSDKDKMLLDSNLLELCSIIENKIGTYELDILEENYKKLKARINDALQILIQLKSSEFKKIDEFSRAYCEFVKSCHTAREDFSRSLKHVGYKATKDVLYDFMTEELFVLIEQKRGRTKKEDIDNIIAKRQADLAKSIQDIVIRKLENARNEFDNSIHEAIKRLEKDFERSTATFELHSIQIKDEINMDFLGELKLSLSDYGKVFFSIGSLAIGGGTIGSLIAPGIGTAIGAGIGALGGLLIKFKFLSIGEDERVNKAKEKLNANMDEIIDNISHKINREIKKANYEKEVDEICKTIESEITKQKESLNSVKVLLNNVEDELQQKLRSF